MAMIESKSVFKHKYYFMVFRNKMVSYFRGEITIMNYVSS